MCTAGLPDGVEKGSAQILLIVNIFFPGVGTLIASCVGSGCNIDTALIGVLQILTVPLLLFGWVWAIVWSVGLIKHTNREKEGGGGHRSAEHHHSGEGHHHNGEDHHHSGEGHHHSGEGHHHSGEGHHHSGEDHHHSGGNHHHHHDGAGKV